MPKTNFGKTQDCPNWWRTREWMRAMRQADDDTAAANTRSGAANGLRRSSITRIGAPTVLAFIQ